MTADLPDFVPNRCEHLLARCRSSASKPMTKEKVGVLKTRFSLSNEAVEVLGFRSSRHATNPGNIHMHARTANAIYHIDEVRFAAGAMLYLPER